MTRNYLKRILSSRVYDVAIESPLSVAAGLSRRLGRSVLLKREDMQAVFSFKLRGAYNKIAHLPPEERALGVITASAGNHAQGVALAARRLGVRAVIVMPTIAPQIKVDAVRELGGEVILVGENYDAAYAHARHLSSEHKLPFIHPYDDPDVIAGQGTIGMEILKQHPADIEAIFVPVGGGGLIAGIALYVKALRPATRIIGVEPADADALSRSLQLGSRVVLDKVGTFADGVAVRQVGREPFRIARRLVDDVLVVSNDAICAAIKDIFEDTRSIVEPSGALAVAGLKAYAACNTTSGTLVAIASGANMNFDRLRHVAERAEIGERREILFAATIPETPGSFRKFCTLVGHRNITEFNYRYADTRTAHVFVGIQVAGGDGAHDLLETLAKAGYDILDLTDNEMAKLHIRHLVGGRCPIDDELIYRFEFPDRPGALMAFLNAMSATWNISLFHYRNHGADYGRVLIGLQVPRDERSQLPAFLETLGMDYQDETDNPAYRLFLR
ncbi:MAG: threonine ammonia-lyase, biosynthetic [Acidiferrobacter sp.]